MTLAFYINKASKGSGEMGMSFKGFRGSLPAVHNCSQKKRNSEKEEINRKKKDKAHKV